MKIIVSHDVDHLFATDHINDLIYPKLWVRETLRFMKGRISFREWYLRMFSPFKRIRHCINEVMSFDRAHGIPSTFFFGMEKGLGMSYKREKALPIIKQVCENGFETGVHGIAFDNLEKIKNEYNAFTELVQKEPKGIRMHYVRHTKGTFEFLAQSGYKYDTSEFDKEKGSCLKAPYKVGDMWEFPLCLMDTYLPYDLEKSKTLTLDLLEQAEAIDMRFFTVLFHDSHYCDAYSVYRDWYRWLINYLEMGKYKFVSYQDAIGELETEIQNGKAG